MVRIDADEWYPVYSVRPDDKYGHEVEATPEQVQRWEAARVAFEAAQDEMGDLYVVAEEKARRAAKEAKEAKEAAEKAERKRIADQQRKAAKEREVRRAAMWDQIKESGGHVYDANGQHIGVLRPASGGISTGVQLSPDDTPS